MTIQQVDLLQAHLTPQKSPLGPKQLGLVWALFSVSLVVISAWYEFNLSDLEDEADSAQGQVALLLQANAQARRGNKNPEALKARVAELSERLAQQDSFLARLTNEATTHGFAARLRALASADTESVWLREIMLSQNGTATTSRDVATAADSVNLSPSRAAGKSMRLHGRALAAGAVPEFLLNLSLQPVFSGQTFSQFTIERGAEPGVVIFDIGEGSSS